MAITLYDATVANFIQTLGGLEGVLTRGLEYCRNNQVDPQTLVETRLFHDMHPLKYQVTSSVAHSLGAIDGVRKGVFSPPAVPELDYTGLQKAVSEARDALKKIPADEVNAFTGRDMRFEIRDRVLPFTAENFLLSFSIPNFYFHAATAYDILRHKGVPVGKRDFMGQPRMKA